jgi:hypothetical protein
MPVTEGLLLQVAMIIAQATDAEMASLVARLEKLDIKVAELTHRVDALEAAGKKLDPLYCNERCVRHWLVDCVICAPSGAYAASSTGW